MDITLKKLHQYTQQVFAAASAINLSGVVSVSIYAKTEVSDIVQASKSKALTSAINILELVSAGNAMHQLHSDKNTAIGINGLLTEEATLKKSEAFIGSVLAKMSPVAAPSRARYGESIAITDIVEATACLNLARKRKETETVTSGSMLESVTIAVFSEEDTVKYRDMLDKIRYRKSEIKDELTALNLNHKVSLSDELVSVLRKHKIIK